MNQNSDLIPFYVSLMRREVNKINTDINFDKFVI